MKINLGCGSHYHEGWINVDKVTAEVDVADDGRHDSIRPDVEADMGVGLPFADGSADLIYLGHIMEHIPWDDVQRVMSEVARVLSPTGTLGVVGPDVHRTLTGWHEGRLPYWLVASVLEHAALFMEGGEGWPGARHSWNCSEERAADVLRSVGFDIEKSYTDDLNTMISNGWPLMTNVEWQFGFTARLA